MAQDFSMRYPLIDGQGNFGSMDGDPAAAMRYTEARMDPLAEELLEDIEKDTVDFSSNYDDRLQEPDVLPSKVPNLLLNGSSGIAVGMSTNIPPHNLGELVDATVQLLENPDCTVEDLMEHIKGPDFPTGGNIVGRDAIYSAYATGRGRLRVRAEYEVDPEEGRIVISELPYQENKARVVERIADDVNEGKIEASPTSVTSPTATASASSSNSSAGRTSTWSRTACSTTISNPPSASSTSRWSTANRKSSR